MFLPVNRSPSPLSSHDQEGHEGKKRGHSYSNSQSKSSVGVVGLRIITQLSRNESKNKVIVKSCLKLSKPIFPNCQIQDSSCEYSCFLKTCHLCKKDLRIDKDVYMYRGDQGFCSIECRSRQIHVDEMRELETSTKKIVSSFRKCNASDRHETRLLLEEMQQRHKPLFC